MSTLSAACTSTNRPRIWPSPSPWPAATATGRRGRPGLVGEVGLSGELRSVGQLPRRLHEAAKLGFTRAMVPRSSLKRKGVDAMPEGIEVIGVRTVAEAIDVALVQER